MTAPKKIAQWDILEPLGAGGNADVWLATDGERQVALKVLKTKKVDSEPYARFRNEIAVLQRFENDAGILPIIEASLPERPSNTKKAWIAMPPAKPVRDALTEKTLREVVEAIAEMSATLARVAAEGIAHRDLKPENLYQHDNRWVVSDFGLAHLPKPGERRLTGMRLGPFGYMPDELFGNAAEADPFPVDVFQLAKCLLVLASGANDPPQGHVPADSSGALSRYVLDPRAAELDQLIDRSTRRDPSVRPTMIEFARELEVWLTYTPPEGDVDVSELIAQFRRVHQGSLDTQSQRDEWVRRLEQIEDQVDASIVTWIQQKLSDIPLRPEVSGWHEHHQWVERMRAMQMEPELAASQRWVTAEFGDVYFPTKIAIGIGIEVDVRGEFWCAGYVAWGDLESTAGNQLEIPERTAHIESIEAQTLVGALGSEIQTACLKMLQDLAARP